MAKIQVEIGGQLQDVTKAQLFDLARAGTIRPDTKIIVDGKETKARKVQGMEFADATLPEMAQLESGYISTSPDNPYIADSEQNLENSVHMPVAISLPTIPDVQEQNSVPLSRAVFIFLAVFVGIFGIHDFYAKRKRQGWIHLCLLSPWVLVLCVSILAVFGWTLYAWSYSPLRKEIQECKRDVEAIQKEIVETKQKLKEALEGKLRKQRMAPNVVRVEPERIRPPAQVDAQNQPDIDWELVNELRELLDDLQMRQWMLERNLDDLETQRTIQKLAAWAPVGSLWLYFFFIVLPFVSWMMAMIEIVYVTRDGTGRDFAY